MSKVLLYSGGTDSWLIDKLWKPDKKIYINIHGSYSDEEIKRLPSDVEIIDLPFLGQFEDKETLFVPLRNLYFLMIASNYGDEICLGATYGDCGSKDKRETFLNKAQDIINYCLIGNSLLKDRHIKICKDFVKLNKFEILKLYLDSDKGTIEEFVNKTFSCYSSIDGKECYHCRPCFKKFLEAYYFGYRYDKETEEKMIRYLKEYVIPKNKYKGKYFDKRPGDGAYLKIAIDKLFKKYGLNWKDYQ